MAEATYSIGLVVEAPDDGATTTTLLDRCLVEGIEWLEAEHLPHLRAWRGIEPGTELTAWKHVTTLARKHRVVPMGFFDGNPGEHDARMARRVLLLFAKTGMPDLVVLVHDADDRPERRDGFEQARSGTPLSERIVIGIADPEREAWVLAGFVPCDEREQSALTSERQRLGFDPTLHPHELRGNGKRSAKAAHASLVGDDRQREHRCLTEPPLAHLRQRGQHTGLAAFLKEIDERIVPVISGQGPAQLPT
jgi:hypothetical protein